MVVFWPPFSAISTDESIYSSYFTVPRKDLLNGQALPRKRVVSGAGEKNGASLASSYSVATMETKSRSLRRLYRQAASNTWRFFDSSQNSSPASWCNCILSFHLDTNSNCRTLSDSQLATGERHLCARLLAGVSHFDARDSTRLAGAEANSIAAHVARPGAAQRVVEGSFTLVAPPMPSGLVKEPRWPSPSSQQLAVFFASKHYTLVTRAAHWHGKQHVFVWHYFSLRYPYFLLFTLQWCFF